MYKDYTKIDWKMLVEYDCKSPTGLIWKINRKPAGYVVGRYYAVNIDKKPFRVHRIIYLLEYGNISIEDVIDHIDGNGLNNLISNLRKVNSGLNSRNAKKSKLNKSGVTGVSYDATNKRWITQWWSLDGHRHKKTFSVRKYGHDKAFELACIYRNSILQELNELGAGYTERHGT